MADDEEDRPSFTRFWREIKQKEKEDRRQSKRRTKGKGKPNLECLDPDFLNDILSDPDVVAPVFQRAQETEEYIKSRTPAAGAGAGGAAEPEKAEAGPSTTTSAGTSTTTTAAAAAAAATAAAAEEDGVEALFSPARGSSILTGSAGDSPGSACQHEQSAEDKEKSAKEKAQARRAQVRRAQIQHRQRKANYVKQLELDISELREMIAAAEAETFEMRKNNEGIRAILSAAGVAAPTPAQQSDPIRHHSTAESSSAASFAGQPSPDAHMALTRQHLSEMNLDQPVIPSNTEMFGDINMDDITVSLSMNDVLGTPCFTISSNVSGTTVQSYASPSQPAATATAAAVESEPAMTPDQETRAINFILAFTEYTRLEHGCWDHFLLGDFHHHHDHVHSSEEAHGHHLMASAYLMANAPESVYSERNTFEDNAIQPPPVFQWLTSGISLSSLYGLALSLNQDVTELTPVQAWFEMAARYPISVLYAEGVLESLEIEFSHVVRCVVFGASMSRAEFEDIVSRVLGSPPEGWSAPLSDSQQWMYAPHIEGPL
ncbi:hypothetical protein PT974_08706 [Cladobotryum mycophilum]|uniref:BZIP domain-containing protein n=1 Tax=Cladobotryum mycophilum TaxID=491253 RepID=A0ABR0SE44_9HYPO